MAHPDAGTVLNQLRADATIFTDDVAAFSVKPGIYAVFLIGESTDLIEFGVRHGDLLYLGKTESSQLSRDLKTHFADDRTGSSTLRRSLGALLRETLGLHPQPRSITEQSGKQFKNYKFDAVGEAALTRWMRSNLGLSFFPLRSGRADLAAVDSGRVPDLESREERGQSAWCRCRRSAS